MRRRSKLRLTRSRSANPSREPRFQPLHREDKPLFAPVQQKHGHAGGHAADEVVHVLDRAVLGGQTGMVHQQIIHLRAGVRNPLRLEAGRVTGGGVQ